MKQQITKILMYHAVGKMPHGEVGGDLYCVSDEKFREQMMYLRNTQYAVRMTEIRITFDDGDVTNFTNAFPILREYELRAHFFILVGKVGTEGYMTWDQIRHLKREGMVIGSHGMTHRILTQLGSEELRYELFESKKILEKELGKTIDSMSIPRGFYNGKVVAFAKEAGYRQMHTSRYREDDEFRRGRIAVKGSWDLAYFKRVIEKGYPLKDSIKQVALHVARRCIGTRNYDILRSMLLRR